MLYTVSSFVCHIYLFIYLFLVDFSLLLTYYFYFGIVYCMFKLFILIYFIFVYNFCHIEFIHMYL